MGFEWSLNVEDPVAGSVGTAVTAKLGLSAPWVCAMSVAAHLSLHRRSG